MNDLLKIEKRKKYTYIKIMHDLTLENSMKIQSLISNKIEYEDILVVDMEEVNVLSSSGAGLVIILMKLSRKVYFINLRNNARQVLKIVGFIDFMNVTNLPQAEAEINGY